MPSSPIYAENIPRGTKENILPEQHCVPYNNVLLCEENLASCLAVVLEAFRLVVRRHEAKTAIYKSTHEMAFFQIITLF